MAYRESYNDLDRDSAQAYEDMETEVNEYDLQAEGDSEFMGKQGLPPMTIGVCYIGKKCFEKHECVVLIAQVKYICGDGSGIPVEISICGKKCKTRMLCGGIAYICVGHLCIGQYKVTVKAGKCKDCKDIIVGCCCHDDKKY